MIGAVRAREEPHTENSAENSASAEQPKAENRYENRIEPDEPKAGNSQENSQRGRECTGNAPRFVPVGSKRRNRKGYSMAMPQNRQ